MIRERMARLVLRLRARLTRRLSRGEEGVALIAIVVMLTVIGATAADFSYSARVDYSAAINSRDELRAHYLARAGVNLARILLRVQQRLVDPMLKRFQLPIDLQLPDYAPILVSAFQSREGAEALSGLLGVEGEISGLGVDVGSFDVKIQSHDGRVNLNCGGGANAGAPAVTRLAATLSAMMMAPRYNHLFQKPDEDGQYNGRLTVMRAIIDWADQDRQMYGSTAPEAYRYNVGKHGYQNKNQYFDTIDELRLVRGVDDDFMAAFGDQVTVYGRCKVNLSIAGWPTLMALIMQYPATPSDPGLQFRNVALLARYVMQIRQMQGGFKTVKAFRQAVANPMAQLGIANAVQSMVGGGQTAEEQQKNRLPPVLGVKLSPKIGEATMGSYARRIWEVKSTAKVGRVQKRIRAVWDQQLISMNRGRTQSRGPGGFVYWREE